MNHQPSTDTEERQDNLLASGVSVPPRGVLQQLHATK
jgi:hypothetical protein